MHSVGTSRGFYLPRRKLQVSSVSRTQRCMHPQGFLFSRGFYRKLARLWTACIGSGKIVWARRHKRTLSRKADTPCGACQGVSRLSRLGLGLAFRCRSSMGIRTLLPPPSKAIAHGSWHTYICMAQTRARTIHTFTFKFVLLWSLEPRPLCPVVALANKQDPRASLSFLVRWKL